MNRKQKLQVSLAALAVIYIIVLLFFPGWGTSKILGIIASVATLIVLYGSYRAEEKKNNTDK